MFRLFKKRSKTNRPSLLDQLLSGLHKKQRLIASFLNNKVNRLNKQWIYLGLAVYCLIYGYTCIYIALRAVDNKGSPVKIEAVPLKKSSNDFDLIPKPRDDTDGVQH
jgi:hypothetical protein